jgi:hypothetical protein
MENFYFFYRTIEAREVRSVICCDTSLVTIPATTIYTHPDEGMMEE